MGESLSREADEGWTTRLKHGTTSSPQPSDSPDSVQSDDATTRWGLECLQTDFCRSLGPVSTCPSTVSDVLLQWSGSQDAGMWQPRTEGLHCLPLPALGPGEALGVDALEIVLMLAVRQSLRRQLGHPGEEGPP